MMLYIVYIVNLIFSLNFLNDVKYLVVIVKHVCTKKAAIKNFTADHFNHLCKISTPFIHLYTGFYKMRCICMVLKGSTNNLLETFKF